MGRRPIPEGRASALPAAGAVGETPAGMRRVPPPSAASDAVAAAPPQSAHSPQMVRRPPKPANIARRRPAVKLLIRTGFQRHRHVPHRRPVLILSRRRPQVHTHTRPPILKASKPSAVETCSYTFAALATAKAARPATSRDLLASCAHRPRNSGEAPDAFSPGISPNRNRYEVAEGASVAVRRSTMESDPSGSKKTSRRQVDSAISAHCNN